MERKFYTDDFEQLLKGQTDEFKMYPSRRVWHSIYNNLYPGKKWPSITATMCLLMILILGSYWNSTTNNTSINSAAIPTQKSKQNISAIQNTFSPKTSFLSNIVPLKKIDVKNQFSQFASTTNTLTLNEKITTENKIIEFNNKNSSAINLPEPLLLNLPNQWVPTNFEMSCLDKRVLSAADQNNDAPNLYAANATLTTTDDKAWLEDYALHQKHNQKKWKGRSTISFYVTPTVDYRKLSDNYLSYISATNTLAATTSLTDGINQKPTIGLEIGAGIAYNLTKKVQLKTGIQFDYTNYVIKAAQPTHPVSSNLLLNDFSSSTMYLSSRASTLINSSTPNVSAHNKTYQIALPIGFAYMLYQKNKLQWYAGASIQPTYIFGGKANLLSADKKNYITDPSLIRSWNFNASVETYLSYNLNKFAIQVGPQFRYQLNSTYSNTYTIKENLYNTGIKIGIVKHF